MGTPIGAPRKSTNWKKAPTLVGPPDPDTLTWLGGLRLGLFLFLLFFSFCAEWPLLPQCLALRQNHILTHTHIGGEQNRGVAVLIHATLQYNRVPLHTILEAAAVTINLTKRYIICSVYLSPNANIDMEELKSLIRQLSWPFLLLGDFNAKHPAWDFENSADPRGRAVQSLLVEEFVKRLKVTNERQDMGQVYCTRWRNPL